MDDGVDGDDDDYDDDGDDNENDYDNDHSKDDDEQEILFPYHPKGLIVVDLQSAIIDDGMMITKIIVFFMAITMKMMISVVSTLLAIYSYFVSPDVKKMSQKWFCLKHFLGAQLPRHV